MAIADGTQAASAVADDSTRGRPYYEKLRRDLKQILDKKRELDRSMSALDNTIARLESNYLDETSAAGNIIKGFDNYIKASTATSSAGVSTGAGTATRRKVGVSDQDRIFSRSSVSWSAKDSSAPLVLTNFNMSATPSGAATPVGNSQSGLASARDTPASTGANSKTGSKTNKKRGGAGKDKTKEEPDEDGERPAKRGKVSWGRD